LVTNALSKPLSKTSPWQPEEEKQGCLSA
jgi:hypothetical protein